MMNYLENWYDAIKEYKWRNGYLNIKPFSNLDEIKEILLRYFPIEHFHSSNNTYKNNFISALLTSGQLSSLYKLNEFAQSLKYLETYTELERIEISSTNKEKINYEEVRNRFFELYINRLISENVIRTSLTSYYHINENKKPLDGYFEFEDESYLIECQKIYNSKQDVFKSISLEVFELNRKHTSNLSREELLSGYIYFKKEKLRPSDKQHILAKFKFVLSEYYRKFRNSGNNLVIPYSDHSDEIIDIQIMSSIAFPKVKKEISQNSGGLILFEMKLKNEDFGGTIAQLLFEGKYSQSDMEETIIKKIKNKKKQHGESPIQNKIFCFEFETVHNFNSFQNSFHVSKKVFDSDKLKSLVSSKGMAILIVLKSIKNDKMVTDFGFICRNDFNPNLRKKFASLHSDNLAL